MEGFGEEDVDLKSARSDRSNSARILVGTRDS